jgi:excisionase family DNA binding protein
MQSERWLGTRAAADALGVELRTLYRLMNEGQIRSYRFGRVYRIRSEDLTAFLNSVEVRPGDLDHLLPEHHQTDP